MDSFNPAIITPYFNEDIATIRRCHESCLGQSVGARHFLVADGSPISEVGDWEAEHLVLSRPHRDYGNTPRGIGALSAINQGYNPILFLDADNWYAEDHVKRVVECRKAGDGAPIVASLRQLVLPDGTLVEPDSEDALKRHIDTSCMAFFEESFFLLPLWCTMTKPLSVVGDRIVYTAIKMHGLQVEWTDQRTVFYATNYRHHYLRAGLEPPDQTYSLNTKELEDYSAERLWKWSRLGIQLRKN